MSELRRQHQELLNVEVRKFAEKLLISNSLKGVSKNFSFNTLYFREDQMSLWVSCMEHYWENMKLSRMILVSWVKGNSFILVYFWKFVLELWICYRYDDLVTSHSAAVAKLEHSQVSGKSERSPSNKTINNLTATLGQFCLEHVFMFINFDCRST